MNVTDRRKLAKTFMGEALDNALSLLTGVPRHWGPNEVRHLCGLASYQLLDSGERIDREVREYLKEHDV